ncbi:shikimate dehydrogenase [Variovorax sp. VNK109]|uniref:shikimate dehydrogenase n=1 Tax=Variovorax sp. VNK109 TaxID=3400919 RepID=UPI003C062CCB
MPDLYCVMGNPVEHSKSPWIHARFAELTRQALRYEKRLIPLEGFAESVQRLRDETAGRARGCNITVPFKFEAIPLAQAVSERAALAAAANVLSFEEDGIHADNTDGVGLVNDIQNNAGILLRGCDLLLIGAGGAASGVLGPLIETGLRSLTLVNRTQSRAATLAARHATLAQKHGVLLHVQDIQATRGSFDVVVNASASSLAGDSVPVDASVLKPHALAVDMMYGPAAQGFLQWAEAHGAVPRDGLGMLVEQAAEAFLIWRGMRPPSAQVLAELRESLAPSTVLTQAA